MDPEIQQKYIQAGRIAAEARDYGASLIVVGANLREVCDAIEDFVHSKNAKLAFPAQISLNDIAAHYCPTFDDVTVFRKGDIAKLDVGVHVDGCIGDTAVTVDLGDHEDLVKASREALHAALALVQPGATLGSLGRAIQQEIQKYQLAPIKNLSGHGLGLFEIHSAPSIPNFDTKDATKLKEGTVIAIEPFATNGYGAIFESSNAEIFSQIASKPIRSPFAREILRDIQDYENLPFAKRWLVKKHGLGKTNFALKELLQAGILNPHPPLPEKNHGLVSQAEHTIIVLEKPIITTQLQE